MAIIEILDVSMSPLNPKRLWGCSIDIPEAGSKTDVYAIDIAGWALTRGVPIVAINIVHEGLGIRKVPLHLPRPDVSRTHSEVVGAETCGFWTRVGVLGMAPEDELRVEAIFEDGVHVSVGRIRIRHQALHSSFQPTLQPLMITSLGRSGTTWMMRVLAEHPSIVVHRLHPYETRAASYWIHMLKVLSEPANHLQSSHPNSYEENKWWVGHHPHFMRPTIDPLEIYDWFGCSYIEDLASFCQRSMEGFYQQVARNQGVTEPIYFAEKHHPMHIPWLIWELYPQAREIFLVRDFRDTVCSMLDFYKKRGLVSFGREKVNNDTEFIQRLRYIVQRLLHSWKMRSGQAHLVRYEDLILRPVETLRPLLDYLSLDSTPSTIEGMFQRASGETSELRQHRTSRDPKASIGRWRQDLDASMQAVCQEILGDALEEFGYTESGYTSSVADEPSNPVSVGTLEA